MKPGDAVTWLYEPRGGYGYTLHVPATVVAVGKKRVLIEAQRNNGIPKRIFVKPERIVPRREAP